VLDEELARFLAGVLGLRSTGGSVMPPSIAFWIGPNAYRLSTKSVIKKQTIVRSSAPA
jgi:hypothetical protein